MTAAEIITYALTQYVNVGQDSAATDPGLRQRSEVRLNNRSGDLWATAPWWYRVASGVVTIASGANSGVCPADFDGRFGTQGGIFTAGQTGQPQPRYMPPAQLFAMREQVPQTSSYPWFYCLSGRDPLTFLPLLQVYPTAGAAYVLNLANYVQKPPALVDKATAILQLALGALSVLDNGAYRYVVTFLTPSGETEAGVPSQPITVVANEEIVLTGIPTSIQHSVIGRGIYRTSADGSTYGLVIDIPDNTTTTLTDTLNDSFLGAPPPDVLTAITGTEVYPEDFHDILLDGLIQELATTQGDLRDNNWKETWRNTVKQRWGEFKQGQNQTQVMPRYGVCNGYASAPRGFWKPLGT